MPRPTTTRGPTAAIVPMTDTDNSRLDRFSSEKKNGEKIEKRANKAQRTADSAKSRQLRRSIAPVAPSSEAPVIFKAPPRRGQLLRERRPAARRQRYRPSARWPDPLRSLSPSDRRTPPCNIRLRQRNS